MVRSVLPGRVNPTTASAPPEPETQVLLVLVVARARGLHRGGNRRAVDGDQSELLVRPAVQGGAARVGGALAVVAIDGAVAVVVDAVVADL
jgi:hypothetical protein